MTLTNEAVKFYGNTPEFKEAFVSIMDGVTKRESVAPAWEAIRELCAATRAKHPELLLLQAGVPGPSCYQRDHSTENELILVAKFTVLFMRIEDTFVSHLVCVKTLKHEPDFRVVATVKEPS